MKIRELIEEAQTINEPDLILTIDTIVKTLKTNVATPNILLMV